MSQDDAKKEVAQLEDFDQFLDYFETCILPKLPIDSQAQDENATPVEESKN